MKSNYDISESTQSSLSSEEWKALRGLAADKTIVIKGADKGSSVVVWDRSDYLHEASRQLQDQNIYENVKFNENILTDLVAKSNKIFKRLCNNKLIFEKELKYFTYNFKKATNLGNLYFLREIHKCLSAIPGRPVIYYYGTPTEKVSEYVDYILKPIMQDSWSYNKDSGDFLKKIKNTGKTPQRAILITADVIGLYPSNPSISHEAGLEAIRKRLNEKYSPKVPTEDIVQMTDFVLKNNFFEFSGEFKRQKSGTAIGTELAPSYACIFRDEVETEFLKSQELRFLWLRYIDNIFFIRTHGE